jgi:hypothetical protein
MNMERRSGGYLDGFTCRFDGLMEMFLFFLGYPGF